MNGSSHPFEAVVPRVSMAVIDQSRLYQQRRQRRPVSLDLALRSLRQLLESLDSEANVQIYLACRLGPPDVVRPGEVVVDRYHRSPKSVELTVGFDPTIPESMIRSTLSTFAISAIVRGGSELERHGVPVAVDSTVRMVEAWGRGEEPAEGRLVVGRTADAVAADPKGPEAGRQDGLEICASAASGAEDAFRDGMESLEDRLDELLGTTGVQEGNEVGVNEWTIYVECADAEAAFARLLPALKALQGLRALHVLLKKRIDVIPPR